MTKVILWRPLHKLKLPNQHRLQPSTFLHLLRGKPRAPAPRPFLRQVHERALRGLQPAEPPIQLLRESRREAVPGPSRVQEAVAFVVAEDQRVEPFRAAGVAADDELLPLIDPHLLPCPRAMTGFILARAAPVRPEPRVSESVYFSAIEGSLRPEEV
jgi:hypothetical protein